MLSSTSRRTVRAVTAALLLLSALALKANVQSARGEPDTITVPDDYAKIQWAIGNATAGDTIFVRNGIYCEHLNVNKGLTLVGESPEKTVVDGNGENQTVIEVAANNVVISGFTVRNSSRVPGTSYAGIKILGGRSACNITGNHVTRNKIGIFAMSKKSRIAENVVTNNGQGIALYDSSEVTVEANNVTANTVGISLALSFNNVIVGNKVTESSAGGHGITLSSNSLNNTILGNNLIENGHGVWLSDSTNNLITENTITNNKILGIELSPNSPDNRIYHNNFLNNKKQVVVTKETPNTWDDGYPSGGNYWSDYEKKYPEAKEIDDSGIWDTPYNINDNNTDKYPLMKPYGEISEPEPIIPEPVTPDNGKLTAKAGSDQTVDIGNPVFFNANESAGDIESFEWNFGDETGGTGLTCSHIYYELGNYTVTLTIRDVTGNFDTDQLVVTVVPVEDTRTPLEVYPPWINALAVAMGITIVVALFWKRKVSKKTRRKKRVRHISKTVIFVPLKHSLNCL